MKTTKTMQDLENQAYRLGGRNWRRENTWKSSAASMAAKNSRDRLIDRAYLSAAAKHLTEKARAIDKHLTVRPIFDDFCVALDYNPPAAGLTLQIAPPFTIESILNNSAEVLDSIK